MKDKKVREYVGYSEGNYYSQERRISELGSTLEALLKELKYGKTVMAHPCGCCVSVRLYDFDLERRRTKVERPIY